MNQDSRSFKPDGEAVAITHHFKVHTADAATATNPTVVDNGAYAAFGKRVFDLVVTVACLPIIMPVLLILWIIVRRDGGAFFFAHPRVGRDGVVFPCMKIRTMVVNADEVLRDILENDPERAHEWKTHFKLRNDPRVTKIGRILRATSLDELPQVFNVLKGEMSIVGPRPITAEELELYGSLADSYRAVRPGLTGPWQITGRRENDFESRARLDAEYVANMSFWRDFSILLRTVPEVLLAKGR